MKPCDACSDCYHFACRIGDGYAVLLDRPWVPSAKNVDIPVVQRHGVDLDEDLTVRKFGDLFFEELQRLRVGLADPTVTLTTYPRHLESQYTCWSSL
jgi:hypothetical protein